MSVAQLTLPMFIGSLLNWLLFGTLLLQTRIYFCAFPDDHYLAKLLVAAVLVLEVIETFSGAHDMIHIFGAGWGNMEALDDVGWAWFSVPVMGSIVASVGQVFFAWRIQILGRNRFVPGLIIITSFVQLVAGVWTGVVVCIAGKFSLLQKDNIIATATWLSATSLCDLIIVISMVYYLTKAQQPEFQKTKPVISRILKITVETGILCALFAIFDLYLFATYKGTNYHLALCIELSKVYSNSMLMIMNSRARMVHWTSTETCHTLPDLSISNILFNNSGTAVSAAPPFQVGLDDGDTESTQSRGDQHKNNYDDQA